MLLDGCSHQSWELAGCYSSGFSSLVTAGFSLVSESPKQCQPKRALRYYPSRTSAQIRMTPILRTACRMRFSLPSLGSQNPKSSVAPRSCSIGQTQNETCDKSPTH